MASAKLQRPANESCSRAQEEQKSTNKMSEVAAWGSRVFGGHKQHEQQTVTKESHNGWFSHKKTETVPDKHCSTCQCTKANKGVNPTISEVNKKEQTSTVPIKHKKSNSPTETKIKRKKEEQSLMVIKDMKCNGWIHMKKSEKKEQGANATHRDTKHNVFTEVKKDKKEEQAASVKANPCTAIIKKDHKEEQTDHCFAKMADHWMEKITMMKKNKDPKHSDSSSSDNEDEAREKRKKEKRHSQGTKGKERMKISVA